MDSLKAAYEDSSTYLGVAFNWLVDDDNVLGVVRAPNNSGPGVGGAELELSLDSFLMCLAGGRDVLVSSGIAPPRFKSAK